MRDAYHRRRGARIARTLALASMAMAPVAAAHAYFVFEAEPAARSEALDAGGRQRLALMRAAPALEVLRRAAEPGPVPMDELAPSPEVVPGEGGGAEVVEHLSSVRGMEGGARVAGAEPGAMPPGGEAAGSVPGGGSAQAAPARRAQPAGEQPAPRAVRVEGGAGTLWEMRPGLLRPQLRRWAERGGYQLVWDALADFEVSVELALEGSFRGAVQAVVESLHAAGAPIRARLYEGNRVIVITQE